MRIIVLNDYGSITGGAAQVAVTSVLALAEFGFDVTFITSVGPIDERINKNNIKNYNFNFSDLLNCENRVSAAIWGVWNYKASQCIGKILEEYDPKDTIIHLHTWVKSLTSSVVHEIISRGFKIVCTLHDYFSVCPNGGFFNYKSEHVCKLKPMSIECILTNCDSRSYGHKIWRVGRQYIQEHFGGIPTEIKHFISISDFSETILRTYLPPSAHYYRVNNPIEILKDVYAKPEHSNIFTFVGRLSPEKGGHIFAKAANEAGVKACFVGSGPEEINLKLLYPEASFLGWQKRDQVFEQLSKSRALVFPSLLYETQGLVVLEAASLGLPSIVSDTCAARDNIIDEVTGLSFKAGNVADLKVKLVNLINNPKYAQQLGSAAYLKFWDKPYTLENHVRELDCCYNKILINETKP
ncbi:MAG: glycosyltransferase family 4 protein [Sedimentibacter sp.]